jgi:protein-disulfide isomerase
MAETKNKPAPKKVAAAKNVEKTETKTSALKNTSLKKAKSNSGITSVILGLVIVQFIVILFLGMSVSTQSEQMDEITKKITRLDTFFAGNAPGYGSTDGTAAAAPSPSVPSGQKIELSQFDLVGEPMIGDKNAPVTIIEYSDYECPFCGKFFSESYGKLKSEYIDTGLVKLVFKDFPLGFHEKAVPASAAANCVQAQLGDEKYFEMHDKIFTTQSSLSVSNLEAWAIELGVDKAAYSTCVVDEAVIAEINADLAEGSQFGVSGTPSFFINGNLIVGAQPFSVLKSMIDSELNN